MTGTSTTTGARPSLCTPPSPSPPVRRDRKPSTRTEPQSTATDNRSPRPREPRTRRVGVRERFYLWKGPYRPLVIPCLTSVGMRGSEEGYSGLKSHFTFTDQRVSPLKI